MKLSTKARYGIRALVELTLQSGDKPVLIRNIAKEQDIPLAYLEQIIGPLVNAGIIRSIKGPKGGILLNRNPAELKLSELIHLLEGSFALVDCVDNPEICERSPQCVTRDVWVKLKDAMEEVLGSLTLQDLVDQQKEKSLAEVLRRHQVLRATFTVVNGQPAITYGAVISTVGWPLTITRGFGAVGWACRDRARPSSPRAQMSGRSRP